MKGQLLHVLIVLLCVAIAATDAFRPRTDSSSVMTRRIRVGETHSLNRLSSPSYSTTAQHAAVKFKNLEQVLDTFREEPVVIYFSTSMCGPCRLMKKEVATVKEMVGDELKMFSIDTEKWPQVGSRFKIARLPCLVVVRGGEVKLRLEGVNSAETVVEKVRSLL